MTTDKWKAGKRCEGFLQYFSYQPSADSFQQEKANKRIIRAVTRDGRRKLCFLLTAYC